MLYDINKISSIGHGDVPSASLRKRGSHINPITANAKIVPQNDTAVNSNIRKNIENDTKKVKFS